jgi:hypothetical protein
MESIFWELQCCSPISSAAPEQVQQSIGRAVLMRNVNAVLSIPRRERILTNQHCVTGTAYNACKRTKPRAQLHAPDTKLVDNLILNVFSGEHPWSRGNIAEAVPMVSAILPVGR